MFKYYFEQIHNVAIWPIISLAIFFIFFLCLLLWTFTTKKSYINYMSQLPVEDQADIDSHSNQTTR